MTAIDGMIDPPMYVIYNYKLDSYLFRMSSGRGAGVEVRWHSDSHIDNPRNDLYVVCVFNTRRLKLTMMRNFITGVKISKSEFENCAWVEFDAGDLTVNHTAMTKIEKDDFT